MRRLVYIKSNAIKALSKISDASMMQSVARYYKRAVVDRSGVSLVSAYHMFKANRDVIKRLVNEVQKAVGNSNASVQYHAIGLMYLIRQHDKLALNKFVNYFGKNAIRSPHGYVMVIRIAKQVMEEERDAEIKMGMFKMIEGWLRHGNDMVSIEAAKAICEWSEATPKELFGAVAVLQVCLSSGRSALRLAAIRILNKLAGKHPLTVATCNVDIEALISDSNRSIATFAITTLLKTGNESSVERLMKQINSFFNEISIEFKSIIVEAIKSLCLKFPKTHSMMLPFLFNTLRDDRGLTHKTCVVNAFVEIIYSIKEASDVGLGYLAEFIEDCSHSSLIVRILYLIGDVGPKMKEPSKYIRYVFNRIMLEKAVVRVAAVDCLIKFANECKELKPSVISMLKSCLKDEDSEVREKTLIYLKSMEKGLKVEELFSFDSFYSLNELENNLIEYLDKNNNCEIDFSRIPMIPLREMRKKKKNVEIEEIVKEEIKPEFNVMNIPNVASLGECLKTCKSIQLTESETEYNVVLTKYLFKEHLVLRFEIVNTLNDQILNNVHVESKCDLEDEIVLINSTRIDELKFNESKDIYLTFLLKNKFPSASFTNLLKFNVKEIDPDTNEPEEEGYNDEYSLEEFELNISDFVLPIESKNFDIEFNNLKCELIETLVLSSIKSISVGISELISIFGLSPNNNSQSILDQNSNSHTLLLSGSLLNNERVLIKIRMVYHSSVGLTIELNVHSNDDDICEAIVNSI
ncbi:Coatomer subunit gamma-like protein 1 [Rozella allomycis CSF55]|uniref:Coatomer subunit gamma n=1 Tax=Rozella allomycis (strain CSF55) TaxID=988480 RepID=A0A075ATZ9_ROZAC|nr:Coatomer subunit gamma-like protein 1 [Rozella allomycis CSF55]|eukprot:EPZ32190.1 Coatomer subunit gamma-like protein 1 [Rozella allomycis CSF55]